MTPFWPCCEVAGLLLRLLERVSGDPLVPTGKHFPFERIRPPAPSFLDATSVFTEVNSVLVYRGRCSPWAIYENGVPHAEKTEGSNRTE